MAEHTSIETVFVSTIYLLQILSKFDKASRDCRELRDNVRALSAFLLFLINSTDHRVKISDQLKRPLLRCGEGCDNLKTLLTESTVIAQPRDYWQSVFRKAKDAICTYMSTFIIGFAVEIL
jgi:Fungal N-terminal domain of STAND proteins